MDCLASNHQAHGALISGGCVEWSWNCPVLLIGGAARMRTRLARLVHLCSTQSRGEFRHLDGRVDSLGPVSGETGRTPGFGTLFVDFLDCLPTPDQYALMDWLESQGGGRAQCAWRLVVGVTRSDAKGVIPQLLDTVNKWRVVLGDPTETDLSVPARLESPHV